ncbi:MAG TPA: anthranilate synthase component I family protein [Pseudolysinimonas sp.]|nr:anthranilate synthase component I family protein [Pseudolysinimonas sp.]
MPTRLLRHRSAGGFTAAAAFRALHGAEGDAFWLDSGDQGTSYLGTGRRIDLHTGGHGSVLEVLRAELARTEIEPAPSAIEPVEIPTAFRLGLVGWLGYELRGETMGLPVRHASRYPDSAFLFVDRAVAIHADGSAELLALGEEWTGELAEWRDATLSTLETPPPVELVETSKAGVVSTGSTSGAVRWRDSEAEYLSHIAACQNAIREGEAYQLCLTTEAELDGPFDALAVHDRLRAASPSHHGGLLRIGGVTLISSSPERFLDVAPDGVVLTRPIKGTRPRSSDPELDARLSDELLASDKERAENVMIVDLMRNDLARVCEVGSVTVPNLLDLESYAQVHQLVSTVRGRLRPGLTGIDAIAACLPAGSMTGAPKRRATELLDDIENRARGLYAGAFGYLGFDGRVDLAMTIRSIVLDDRGATVGAGGGITALSVPLEEVAEVRVKAAALLRALGVE